MAKLNWKQYKEEPLNQYHNLSYEERLWKLDVFSLKDHRICGDLIKTFEIIKIDIIAQ